jgi:hypothetical protein
VLQRELGVFVEELTGGDEVARHAGRDRFGERAKLPADGRIELQTADLFGYLRPRRLVRSLARRLRDISTDVSRGSRSTAAISESGCPLVTSWLPPRPGSSRLVPAPLGVAVVSSVPRVLAHLLSLRPIPL